MPANRDKGIISSPITWTPEQQVPESADAPSAELVPVSSQRPSNTENFDPLAAPVGSEYGADQVGYVEENSRDKGRGTTLIIGAFVVALTCAGAAGVDGVMNKGKHVEAVFNTVIGWLPAGSPVAPNTTTAPVPTSGPEPTTSETPLPTPTVTAPKPSPTATPKSTPTKLALPPTAEGCAAALPADLKVGQLIETTIDANSDMGEIQRIVASGYAGSLLTLHYPLEKDGKTPDVAAIKALKTANKDVPTLITIDGEGGQINRLPGATVPPGPEALSKTKLSVSAFKDKLVAYDKQLKNAGVDNKLAPVADIQGASKEKTYGRLFDTPADAAKYMPSYLTAAKTAGGPNLTFKHFPQVLEYGNTDLKSVTTPSYDVLLKSGVLNSYKLIKGTDAWVMIGNAKTAFPNNKLDNGQIAAFNPAAYNEARKLAGDPLFITDALNAKAVNAVTTQAEAAARAIKAGAAIAMVVPREGYSTTDTRAAFAEVKKLPSSIIDDRFLKVLGAKGVNACTVLSKDPRYAGPSSAAKTTEPTPQTNHSTTATTKPAATPTTKVSTPVKVVVTTSSK
jgi:beta-glucosidase-like glycosyl hydrolase